MSLPDHLPLPGELAPSPSKAEAEERERARAAALVLPPRLREVLQDKLRGQVIRDTLAPWVPKLKQQIPLTLETLTQLRVPSPRGPERKNPVVEHMDPWVNFALRARKSKIDTARTSRSSVGQRGKGRPEGLDFGLRERSGGGS
eukprot:15174728-Alexandrium_andersonii.AAC.1